MQIGRQGGCLEKIGIHYGRNHYRLRLLNQEDGPMLTPNQKEKVLAYIRSLKINSFHFRDVIRILDLDSDDRRSLQHHLDELDAEGIIHRIKRGRYSLPARENLVTGVLSCHKDGFGFLIPDDRSRYKEDIFIPARNMEDALHEDRVLAKVENKKMPVRRIRGGRRRIPAQDDRKRLEGAIVRVLERKRPVVIGRYYDHPRFPFVIPLDARVAHDIRIPFQYNKGAKDGQIVALMLTLPPGRNQHPLGKITEILGYAGDEGIEYRIVEHKFGLPVEFKPETLAEAAAIPDRLQKEDYGAREDFRGELIITIDGESARDFDDAVSLKKLPSGNYLLSVHIADVSHYVREDTALDSEAYARGTSVYFPDRAIPMLPPKLSSGICSLKPDADRLALSVIMEVTPKGKVANRRFARGVICSRARMTYTSVAKILIDRDPQECARYAELVSSFELMEELCLILARKRYRRGAIDFDLPESEITFDASGQITRIAPAERNIAHRMIEEFMLLANECVAEELTASAGPALYRVHEEPDPQKVEEFAEFARTLGYRLEAHDGEYRPKCFQKFIAQLEGKPEQKFLIYLMLRSFMQAHYSEKNSGHFGLAAADYTHFTSPIRRYPDLVVHRLLKRLFEKKPPPEWKEAMTERLPDIAKHTSARERNADEAEREIEKIKKAQYMAGKIGEEFDAVVFSPSRNGFFVELLDPYVEGYVPIDVLIDDHYEYKEKTRSFIGTRRRRRFQLGSRVRVRLDSADQETARLLFSVVG